MLIGDEGEKMALLRVRIDDMPNPEYQRLLRCDPREVRRRLPGGHGPIADLLAGLDDVTLMAAIRSQRFTSARNPGGQLSGKAARTLTELGMWVSLRPGELYGLHGHRVNWLRELLRSLT